MVANFFIKKRCLYNAVEKISERVCPLRLRPDQRDRYFSRQLSGAGEVRLMFGLFRYAKMLFEKRFG